MGENKGGNIWFTSDQHFGHRLVSRLRGFGEDTDAHDASLMKIWREHIKDDDQVWVLGDISMSRVDYALELMAQLPGHKHLIPGNHDACHPMHAKAHKEQHRYLKVFESVQAFSRRKIGGQQVLLSHFPYAYDRTEARYMQYRLRDEGTYLLHGHTHERFVFTSDREIHVGLDAWELAPVSVREIEAVMEDLDEIGFELMRKVEERVISNA